MRQKTSPPLNFPCTTNLVTLPFLSFPSVAHLRNDGNSMANVGIFFLVKIKNGSIIDGLTTWRKNVTGALKGQTECAICYSIISADRQLPSKRCNTCKNLFHAGMFLLFSPLQSPSISSLRLVSIPSTDKVNPIGRRSVKSVMVEAVSFDKLRWMEYGLDWNGATIDWLTDWWWLMLIICGDNTGCLYKWFKSSNSSSCPLCRNAFTYG